MSNLIYDAKISDFDIRISDLYSAPIYGKYYKIALSSTQYSLLSVLEEYTFLFDK